MKGGFIMKLNHKTQMIIAVGIVVIFYILAMVYRNMIFRSLGLVLCGLLYTIHPVVQEGEESNKDLKRVVRIAGIVLILVGLFTTVR